MPKKCKTCYGYGLWNDSSGEPMGEESADFETPTKPCPECGANANPNKKKCKSCHGFGKWKYIGGHPTDLDSAKHGLENGWPMEPCPECGSIYKPYEPKKNNEKLLNCFVLPSAKTKNPLKEGAHAEVLEEF